MEKKINKSQIFTAIGDGDKGKLCSLIRGGAKLDIENERGMKPLHLAAFGGHEDIVKLLVEVGADPNSRESFQNTTALISAASQGYKNIIEYLVSQGAEANIKDDKGRSALHHAVATNDPETIQILVKNGANVDVVSVGKQLPTPLAQAVYCASPEIVSILLEAGTNVDIKNKTGSTVLHQVILFDDRTNEQVSGRMKKIGKMLLEASGEVNCQDNSNMTPLHYAVKHNKLKWVRLLLAEGADSNSRGPDYKTPLHFVTEKETEKNIEIMEILLENGADVSLRDDYGWSPLACAAWSDNQKMIDILQEQGACEVQTKRDAAGRPHSYHGPALQTGYGVNIYAIHGNEIDKKVIECPNSITP